MSKCDRHISEIVLWFIYHELTYSLQNIAIITRIIGYERVNELLNPIGGSAQHE